MMSPVKGQGTLGRHLIHYILHRPFYKRALCWSGAGAVGADSSPWNSWKDRWIEAAWRGSTRGGSAEAGPSLQELRAGRQLVNKSCMPLLYLWSALNIIISDDYSRPDDWQTYFWTCVQSEGRPDWRGPVKSSLWYPDEATVQGLLYIKFFFSSFSFLSPKHSRGGLTEPNR